MADPIETASGAVEAHPAAPPLRILQQAAGKTGGRVVAGQYVTRGELLQRGGMKAVIEAHWDTLPESQKKQVRCGICLGACLQPVSGKLAASGAPCCGFKQWLCEPCLRAHIEHSGASCPICRAHLRPDTNEPLPKELIREKLYMLVFGCTVEGCGRQGFDVHSLVAHMVNTHGNTEQAMFDKEVKILHYDMLYEDVRKLRLRARAAEVQRGVTRTELEVFARKTREKEEQLLLRHARQLAKQEASWSAERLRYEHLLEEKNRNEAAAFTRLAELCFEAAAGQIRNSGDVKQEPDACRRDRSRSPARAPDVVATR